MQWLIYLGFTKQVRRTEVGGDGVHVGVAPLPDDLVAAAVAVGEKAGGVVGDKGEDHHGDRAKEPAELSRRPGEGEHAGAYDRRDNVRTRRAYRS